MKTLSLSLILTFNIVSFATPFSIHEYERIFTIFLTEKAILMPGIWVGIGEEEDQG